MSEPRPFLHVRVPLSLSAIVLGALACQINLGGAEPPDPAVQALPAEAENLSEIWESALSLDPSANEVMILISEQQLTSYLALRLESFEDPLLSQPQVHLREGRLQIYGVASRGLIRAGVALAITPLLDEEGSIAFEVTSADLGPFPAPVALRESLSSILTEAFTGTLGPWATGLQITSLAIADGQVAIVGKLR